MWKLHTKIEFDGNEEKRFRAIHFCDDMGIVQTFLSGREYKFLIRINNFAMSSVDSSTPNWCFVDFSSESETGQTECLGKCEDGESEAKPYHLGTVFKKEGGSI